MGHYLSRNIRVTNQWARWMLLLALVLSGFAWLYTPKVAQAEVNSCGLVVEIIAAPYAAVDSNKPGLEGPKVAMMGARITNASGIVVKDLSVSFSSASLTLLNVTKHTYLLNDLAANTSVTAYWPVTYPATFNVSHGYTVKAFSPEGCSASKSSQITTQSEISATSNKLLGTGGSLTVTPNVVTPGSLVTVRVTGFTLGTIGQGPKGEYDAWLQPLGNLDFDPSCLRLVRSEVKLASIRTTPFIDQLYFSNLRAYRADATDYVAYTFIALRVCSTIIQPYQEAASGTQEKYNGDFSATTSRVGLTSSGTSALKIEVQPNRTTVAADDLVRYTVIYSAPDAPVGYPSNGNPAIINVNIPAQSTYVATSATETSSADAEFSTDSGSTWVTTEPANPAIVTDIRWILANTVDATAQQAQFDVVVNSTYNGAPLAVTATGTLFDGSTLTAGTTTVTKGVSNASPTAHDDIASTASNVAIAIPVAANDSDADGNLNVASTSATTQPANGTLSSNGNGTFTYTPNTGFEGTDSFTYQICDTQAACTQATVTVYVGAETLRWESSSTFVAYEDLKNVGWSDWDYNDFVVEIETSLGVDSADRLAAVEIHYDAQARGAGYAQRFMHDLPIVGGGTAILSLFDSSGNLLSQRTTSFGDNTNFTIFERTNAALPPMEGHFDTNTRTSQPGTVEGQKATLRVYLNAPEANHIATLLPPPWDPYIYVYYTQEEIHLPIPGHLDNTQIVNPARDPSSPLVGYDLPLAQTFDLSWKWPIEFSGIWRGYPLFVNFMGSGGASAQEWWKPENTVPSWLWSPTGAAMAAASGAVEETEVESRYFAGPVAADLNGDGWNEMIIGNLLSNQVEVYNVRGHLVAGWPQNVGAGIKTEPVIADLDGDGNLDILVGTSSGMLFAWRANGQLLTGWPVALRADFRILATPATGDLDGDGSLDIIVPVTDGKLYAVNAQGGAKAGFPVSIGDIADLYGGQVLNSSPKLADLDGDGTLEIVVGSTDKRVYAINHDGSVRWTYPTGDMVLSTPAIADINPLMPGLEIAIGSGDRYMYLLDAEGNALWRQPTGWTIRSSSTLADLDGDQDLEIIVGSDDDRVWAWHHTGEMVEGWPQSTGADVFSSPQVGDIDGDGDLEVIAGSDDANVWAWHSNGSLVEGWPRATNLSVKGAPLLANLDDDSLLEVAAADLSGTIHSWNVDTVSFSQPTYLPTITNQPNP